MPTERRGGVPYMVSGLQVDVRVMTGARNAPLLLSAFCALITVRTANRRLYTDLLISGKCDIINAKH